MSSSQPERRVNKLAEYLASTNQLTDVKLVLTDEEVFQFLRELNFHDRDPNDVLDTYHKYCDMMVETYNWGCAYPRGAKPKPNDPDVHLFKIPPTSYAVRIFPGGLAKDRVYVLDFFDTRTKQAVNSSVLGWDLHPASCLRASAFHVSDRLKSWEVFNIALDKINPGQERFSVVEGSAWTIVGADIPVPVVIEIPVRPLPRTVDMPPTAVRVAPEPYMG